MAQNVIAIASDHAGFEMKSNLRQDLEGRGLAVLDLGPDNEDSVDYPDFAAALAGAIGSGDAGRGILVCGSGIGMSIAANRFPEIRAALVHDPEAARLSRQHNNANVLVLAGRFTPLATAIDCVDAFLNTEFEGGRHERRVAKLAR